MTAALSMYMLHSIEQPITCESPKARQPISLNRPSFTQPPLTSEHCGSPLYQSFYLPISDPPPSSSFRWRWWLRYYYDPRPPMTTYIHKRASTLTRRRDTPSKPTGDNPHSPIPPMRTNTPIIDNTKSLITTVAHATTSQHPGSPH